MLTSCVCDISMGAAEDDGFLLECFVLECAFEVLLSAGLVSLLAGVVVSFLPLPSVALEAFNSNPPSAGANSMVGDSGDSLVAVAVAASVAVSLAESADVATFGANAALSEAAELSEVGALLSALLAAPLSALLSALLTALLSAPATAACEPAAKLGLDGEGAGPAGAALMASNGTPLIGRAATTGAAPTGELFEASYTGSPKAASPVDILRPVVLLLTGCGWRFAHGVTFLCCICGACVPKVRDSSARVQMTRKLAVFMNATNVSADECGEVRETVCLASSSGHESHGMTGSDCNATQLVHENYSIYYKLHTE